MNRYVLRHLLIATIYIMVGLLLSSDTHGQDSRLNEMREIITPQNATQLDLIHQWQAYAYATPLVEFSPSTGHLMTAGPNQEDIHELKYFNVDDATPMLIDHNLQDVPQSRLITDLTFFNDGQNLVVAWLTEGVITWNIQNGNVTSYVFHNWATDVIGSGSSIMVAGGERQMLTTWGIATSIPSPDAELPLPDDYEFNPYISGLVAAAQTQSPIADFISDPTRPLTFVLTEDGVMHKYVWTTPLFPDPEPLPQEMQEIRHEPIYDGRKQIAIHPEGPWIAYTGSYRDVVVYDYVNDAQLLRYPIDSMVGCVVMSPDSQLLVIGEQGDDADLVFIDTNSMQEIGRIDVNVPIYDCTYSPEGNVIATSHPAGSIALWGIKAN